MRSRFLERVFARTAKDQMSEPWLGVRRYELTIIRYMPDPVPMTNVFGSANAALSWLGIPTDTDFLVEAAVSKDNVSWGDFCLWCTGEYACARIGEHREHDASHPDSNFATGKTITFKDDDGSPYTPSSTLLLPRELAIRAMRAWLVDQKHPDFLNWS